MKFDLVTKNKCSICHGEISQKYMPMKEWNIEGDLCGKCYSKKISSYYPGSHERITKR